MATYAPLVRDTKYSWRKSGIFELKVTTGALPPWLDQKVLIAAQAAGSTLDWDLRHKPDLWKAVELWVWKTAKPDNPDQPALFAIDRTDPLSHLDMADFLGEAKVVAMSADCTDRNMPLWVPEAYNYTLVLWFSIDVEKAFVGEQGEKALQRRKLQWVLGEKRVGHLTLNYMEATQVEATQAELGLDDDDDDDEAENGADELQLAKDLRDGTVSVTINGQPVDAAKAFGLTKDTEREIPFTPKPAPEIDGKALASLMAKALATSPYATAEQLAEVVGHPYVKVVHAAYETPAFQVLRARVGGPTGSIKTMVWLKNLALQPMFEDAAIEEKRLLAARADLLRLAEHVLAEAGTVMDGRTLLDAVCAKASQGNVARMLGQGLPADERFVCLPAAGFSALSLDSDLCDDWSKWTFRLAGAAASPAVAAAPEPEALPPVRWPDLDELDSVEVRMARMDKRIADAMVESLRNANFDRSIHNVILDCNQAVTCTLDDVTRLAEADPRFVLHAKRGSQPARIELVADPSREDLRSEVASWVEAAVGYRMSKGELATRIQERWKLRNAAVGRAWLDFAVMPDNPQLTNLKANGIGLAAHWPQ